eukprot:9225063-Ditylum_brightwellii.AAC.1
MSLNVKPSPRTPHYTIPCASSRKKKKNRQFFASPLPASVAGSISDVNTERQTAVWDFSQYGVYDPEQYILQNSSKSDPFITFVDDQYPERNGGLHGYDVTHVQDIDHNNFERDAYKICVEVSPFDFQEYTMAIPFKITHSLVDAVFS